MKYTISMLIIVILVLIFGAIWTYFQWTECRNANFSIFYCLQHIS